MPTPRRRQIYIEVENDGFKLVTRSGSWMKRTEEALFKDLKDYIEVIRRDMKMSQTGGTK